MLHEKPGPGIPSTVMRGPSLPGFGVKPFGPLGKPQSPADCLKGPDRLFGGHRSRLCLPCLPNPERPITRIIFNGLEEAEAREGIEEETDSL